MNDRQYKHHHNNCKEKIKEVFPDVINADGYLWHAYEVF